MDITKLTELFSKMLGHKVFAINFPAYNHADNASSLIKLEIITGVAELGGVQDFNIEFAVKSTSPAEAEATALSIINKLDNIHDIEFNEYQIILIKASATQPFCKGVTDNAEYVFTTDFRILITKI